MMAVERLESICSVISMRLKPDELARSVWRLWVLIHWDMSLPLTSPGVSLSWLIQDSGSSHC